MTLEEKLELWVKITGVDPNQTNYSIRFDGGLSSWDIKKMNDRITEALKYDAYGYFADAYLNIYFKEYLSKKQISLMELITNEQMKPYMDDIMTLYWEMGKSESEQKIINAANKALDFYGLRHENLQVFDIIELQMSAKRCMENNLRRLQFSTGPAANNGFRVSSDIYMYKNLDALLLCAANNTIDGVSLGYIRNEKMLTDSYFAFIIKNGQNLYLLTDMPKYDNPIQNRMSRCPGRNMSNRIESNFFPYQTIADIDTSDLWGSGRYGISETSNALTQHIENSKAYRTKIGTFDSLDEQEAFWTVTMLDMIKQDFYITVPQYEISYTGSMIQIDQLEDAQHALMIRSAFPVMELPQIQINDTLQMEFEQRKEVDGVNDDLFERYKDQLDTAAFNLIQGTDKFVLADEKYSEKLFFGDVKHELIAFDRNMCGTKEEILYHQQYIERYNCSKQIQKLLDDDFAKNRNVVVDKIRDLITPQIRDLCKLCLKGKLKEIIPVQDDEKIVMKIKSFSKVEEFEHWYQGSYIGTTFRYGYKDVVKNDMHCYFSQKAPGVIFTITPKNLQDLLLLCGCNISELPEQIQNWHNKPDYYGNPILQNVDPLLWNINDPFQKLDFDISVVVSKKEYLKICEEAGVEKIEFWKDIAPVCCSNNSGCTGKRRYVRNEDGNYGYQVNKKCLQCPWYKENLQKGGYTK